MAEPRVAELLGRSLRSIRAEAPDSHAHLTAALGRLTVRVQVDGEQFGVRAGPDTPRVDDLPAPAADVTVRTGREAVLDVLDGRLTLADAVLTGRVDVHGSLDDVLRAHDALLAYAHAAARAPSVSGLLGVLRGIR